MIPFRYSQLSNTYTVKVINMVVSRRVPFGSVFGRLAYILVCECPERSFTNRNGLTCMLGDCDECETVSILTNKDLEDLGLLLLDCMEVTGKRRARTAIDVQRERATNKVFGLSDPERWSSSKKLIDFLDDLFGACRRPEDKLDKPVSTAYCSRCSYGS